MKRQHPDGSQFTARGKLKLDEETGEVLVDEFSLTCDGDEDNEDDD